MTAFDRQQIIEDAAKLSYAAHFRNATPDPVELAIERDGLRAALPVIVAGALKPIREQHGVPHWCMDDEGRSDCYHPDGMGMPWPCSTIQLCDEIEADVKGGQ